MKKIVIILMSTVFMFLNLNVFAEENYQSKDTTINLLSHFNKNVYNSEYYFEYKDRVESINVNTMAETDEGIRYTISFKLSSEEEIETSLVFVGDENGEIILVDLILQTEDLFSIDSLMEGYSTTISTRKPIELCDNFVCTKTGVKYVHNGACSFIVGQACNGLSVIGNPIKKYLCKFGVVILCGLQTNACLEFTAYSDVCTL